MQDNVQVKDPLEMSRSIEIKIKLILQKIESRKKKKQAEEQT